MADCALRDTRQDLSDVSSIYRIIKKDEMGGTWSTHGRDKKFIHIFSLKNLKGDLAVGGMIILKWGLKIGCVGVDCIRLSQDRDQWRFLVNLRAPYKVVIWWCCSSGFWRLVDSTSRVIIILTAVKTSNLARRWFLIHNICAVKSCWFVA
jgi:hypothetical protein